MARRPLQIGEIGNISVTQKDGKTVARCRVRAQDGTIKFAQATVPKMTKTATREATALCRQDAEEKASNNSTDGDITKESPLNVLLSEWWEGEKIRAANGDITESTLDAYRRSADTIRETIGGTLKLRECTTPRLQRFVLETSGKHYTVHKQLKRILVAVFDRGLELGVVEHNPASYIRRPPVPKTDTTALTEDEVMRLRQRVREYDNGGSNHVDPETGKHAPGRPRARYLADLVDVMLATGTRIGEALALRWQDIDFTSHPTMETAAVEVSGTVKTRKAEKATGKSYLWRQPFPKTKRSHRIITVPRFAVDVLLRRQAEADGSLYVFATSAGTLRSPANVRTALRKACGTDFEGVTPHTLRRTVATLVAGEHGIETASRLLGHADISITDRAYNRPGTRAPDTSVVLGGLGVPLEAVGVESA